MPGEKAKTEEFDCFLSHNSKDKPAVRELADALRQRGFKVWLDEDELIPGGDWQQTLEEMIKTLQSAAVLVGSDGIGPWQNAEMRACLTECVDRGLSVIPVLLPGVSKKPKLPLFLKRFTWLDLRAGHLTEDGLARLEWAITGEKPDRLKKRVGSKGTRSNIQVAPSRLPITGSILVGREKELKRLDEAWGDSRTNLMSIVAWGGVGKTALAQHWLGEMSADGYRGAEKVFDWTFYSQGTREQATSTDQFIDRALRFFGVKDPTQGGLYEKGERLALLVAQSRTLLVLDGLEPLQHPPGALEGRLKDPALEALIRGVSLNNPGLCILTTREPVAEVAHLSATTAPRIELEHLSPKAGALLLKNLEVKGTEKELQEASQAFAGHALALTLLGTYLSEVHSGGIRHWKEVPLLDKDAPQGGHAHRMMQSYQKWLGEGPEWSLLQLMGFFDRPAKGEEIQALLAEPSIEGLTDQILELDQTIRRRALSRLRRLRLLAEAAAEDLDGMDAHPLLREYLAEQLQHSPETFQEGHRRLFTHLRGSTQNAPNTLEEMQPLFEAVVHGCQAHEFEAAHRTFQERISRGEQSFSLTRLSAHSSNLYALSGFFAKTWDQPASCLSEWAQCSILHVASRSLQALGQLDAAANALLAMFDLLEPGWQPVQSPKPQYSWRIAAQACCTLSSIYLTLGNIPEAHRYASQAVVEARSSGEDYGVQLSDPPAFWANLQHQLGNPQGARSGFEEAELIKQEQTSDEAILDSIAGFMYSELLIDLGESARVQDRSDRILKDLDGRVPLESGLAQLSKGKSLLFQFKDRGSPSLSRAIETINQALDSLRKAGQKDLIVRGLIIRAQALLARNSLREAQEDLQEASWIASSGPMPLLQADIHLEQVRLFRALGDADQARHHITQARELIRKHGYQRRKNELKVLEGRLEDALLRNRYHQLVDLKHLGQLTTELEEELVRISRRLDELEEPFYRPILAELEKRLSSEQGTDD